VADPECVTAVIPGREQRERTRNPEVALDSGSTRRRVSRNDGCWIPHALWRNPQFSSFGMRVLAQARNPHFLLWLWIPGSLALLAPRNDEWERSRALAQLRHPSRMRFRFRNNEISAKCQEPDTRAAVTPPISSAGLNRHP
jgi:hypothetical protein